MLHTEIIDEVKSKLCKVELSSQNSWDKVWEIIRKSAELPYNSWKLVFFGFSTKKQPCPISVVQFKESSLPIPFMFVSSRIDKCYILFY